MVCEGLVPDRVTFGSRECLQRSARESVLRMLFWCVTDYPTDFAMFSTVFIYFQIFTAL